MSRRLQRDATGRVRALLARAPRVVILNDSGDQMEVELYAPAELEAGQVGYSVDVEGRSLIGGDGGWRAEWVVIGIETLLGDPIFVDVTTPQLPVFTAMHGMGKWDPELIADSLEQFLGIDLDV